MAVGRFLCVGLPLILTIGAIVSMLIATLSGVAHNRLSLFSLDTEELSISRADIDNVADKLFDVDLPDIKARQDVKSDNITAKDLQLGKSYDVNLWGYCWTDFDSGDRHCSDAEYNWASKSMNTSSIQDPTGQIKISLPEELEGAIKAFTNVSKWTQIATVIALIALGIELIVGIFSNFSRVVSCVTWLVAGIATVLTGVAATLATVQAALVVGAVESTAKWYGVRGSINTNYLATVWISFAFAMAAGLFWLFTICCCKPDRNSGRKNKHASSSGEKLFGAPSTGYAPLGNDHEMTSGMYNNGHQAPSYSAPRYPDASAPRSDMAYEPYSSRV
ncbi:integral membrane [Paramyrothecium foliicola]|nr:integral membrane [Paramyrothecium foliicola]